VIFFFFFFFNLLIFFLYELFKCCLVGRNEGRIGKENILALSKTNVILDLEMA
jgi:hypothetical protein